VFNVDNQQYIGICMTVINCQSAVTDPDSSWILNCQHTEVPLHRYFHT